MIPETSPTEDDLEELRTIVKRGQLFAVQAWIAKGKPLFDILTKPALDLTENERQQVKKAARELLDTLKTVKLVIDWRKRQAARAAVRQHIEVFLDANLPDRYSREIYSGKCEAVYQHVYDNYYGGGRSVYA